MSSPITTQAVVAFLRKNGFPIAKSGLGDARKTKSGAEVRKMFGQVSVRAAWPFDPVRCSAELGRMADVLATTFDIEREEHRLVVRAKTATPTTET